MRIQLALWAFVFSIVAPCEALATVITYSYYGTVTYGAGDLNIGGILASGTPFSVTVTFDTTLGPSSASANLPFPASYGFSGNYNSAYSDASVTETGTSTSTVDSKGNGSFSSSSTFFNLDFGPAYPDYYEYRYESASLTIGPQGGEFTHTLETGYDSGGFGRDFPFTDIVDFTVTNFSISPAVPEPSTWAMMLLGFAGLAAVSRRLGQSDRRVVI